VTDPSSARAPVTAVDILTAARRVATDVSRPPLVHAAWLSPLSGAEVHLKLESLQRTGSFKVRGAFNALRQLPTGTVVVTASAGNHGRAVACAAEALGLPATIFTPRNAPRIKLEAIAGHGAELQAVADDYDDAERRAKAFADATGAMLLLADHPAVIAGAGTIGFEIFADLPEVGAIVVPLGSGGLLAGIAIAARAAAGEVEIVGVEAAASTAYSASLAAGRIVEVTVQPTIAEGLAGNLAPDSIAFDFVKRLVDRVVTVDEAALAGAIRDIAAHEHVIVEGAGAAAVAALMSSAVDLRDRTVVAVVSGGNIDMARFMEAVRT
jgi:threonine dehydratase